MQILIAGSHGLIGNALCRFLTERGHRISRLVRSVSGVIETQIVWNPIKGMPNPSVLENFDVIINLAGENIAQAFWTKKRKQALRDSRIITTSNLCNAINATNHKPPVLINASAVGYYGYNRKDICDESSNRGNGFLAELCADWENATQMINSTVRVVNPRFGVVMSTHGGMLNQMLRMWQLGLGTVFGSGEQAISWISLPDCLRAIEHCLSNSLIKGAVNFTTTQTVTNKQLACLLSDITGIPYRIRVPSGVLEFLLSDFAREVLLTNLKCYSRVLEDTGFLFNDIELFLFLKQNIGTKQKSPL